VERTAFALTLYGVGLLGLVAVKVLAPGYYASLDIRTPVKIAVAVLVITQVFNVLFVPFLQHAALTLSIGLGALINAAWLLHGLVRRGHFRPAPGWGASACRWRWPRWCSRRSCCGRRATSTGWPCRRGRAWACWAWWAWARR
jgi:peptidoglycan biosynthesis protein MviN/MurJ (putative lipid II flippase)